MKEGGEGRGGRLCFTVLINKTPGSHGEGRDGMARRTGHRPFGLLRGLGPCQSPLSLGLSSDAN
jgi:hypothetical protein